MLSATEAPWEIARQSADRFRGKLSKLRQRRTTESFAMDSLFRFRTTENQLLAKTLCQIH